MKALITLSSFAGYSDKPLKRLKTAGFEIITNPFGRKLSSQESLRLYTSDIDGVIAGTEEISADVLEGARSLKVISRCGVGLDNIDLQAAQKRKVAIFNTTASVVDAVAELTVGLILDCLRSVSYVDKAIRANQWQRPMGYLLKNKTLGIIGLGQIGKRVVELCKGFNVNIIAYDIHKDKQFARKHKIKFVSLDNLLRQAEIVSIHLPLNEKTQNLIDVNKLNLMKQNAFLINTSRGNIIDEQALYQVLKAKRIAGAALDVFNEEPYHGPLCEFDNIVLTTHIGSYAREARVNMEIEAVENLIKGLKSYKNSKKRN